MRIMVKEVRYECLEEKDFIPSFNPYAHQRRTLEHIRGAIKQCRTICIENTSMTGSGKTLANFAAAILDGVRTCGVYPTNELLQDQYVSMKQFLYRDTATLDSQGLDDILTIQTHMKSHAQVLAWATGDELQTAVFTNPDVLYLAMYDLYGQMFTTYNRPFGERVFRHMLANYPVIAFDEFHLYSPKQIANAAFIMGTAKELAPHAPHIFIFSSATPQPLFRQYAQRLQIDVLPVSNAASTRESDHVVCEPVEINFIPADLRRWQGGDAIRQVLEKDILDWADNCTPPARGVLIVDGVYEAKLLAQVLCDRYDRDTVGEVHGYIDDEERAVALQRRLSVGTTTIDVGVDLTGKKAKDFLVCEARSAAQAIQRIGRLGRQRREPGAIPVPNRIWLVVPEYVYNFIENKQLQGQTIERDHLNHLLHDAYLRFENFLAYVGKYSPLEAVAACERIKQQYLSDIKERDRVRLHKLVPTLYGKEPPGDQKQAEQSYNKYRSYQRAIWQKFGTEVKNTGSGRYKRYYLSDLESFRGGMESDFTVLVYDDLDEESGIKPIKAYNLPFLLRRTHCEEIEKQHFIDLVKQRHSAQAEEWLQSVGHQRNILGYIHVHQLIERGKANDVYFEFTKPSDLLFEQVVRLQRLIMVTSSGILKRGEGSINERLKKRPMNCWISEKNSFRLSDNLCLPPLFNLYKLHAVNSSGTYSEWSIVFGLDAFLLDSISKKVRWAGSRSDNTAIII